MISKSQEEVRSPSNPSTSPGGGGTTLAGQGRRSDRRYLAAVALLALAACGVDAPTSPAPPPATDGGACLLGMPPRAPGVLTPCAPDHYVGESTAPSCFWFRGCGELVPATSELGVSSPSISCFIDNEGHAEEDVLFQGKVVLVTRDAPACVQLCCPGGSPN